jgi:thioredoxin 1
MERLFTALIAAALLLMGAPGCGGSRPPVAAKPDTTAQTGAVCDTALDTAAVTAAAVQPKAEPETPRPGIEPANVAEKPAGLPKMWDFGSTTCLPCKTMKQILDPMISDYKDKVDIRIIDVYKEKEQTKEFKIVTIPTQVFIDASGKELYRHIGVYPRDSIETCFRKFSFPVVPSTSPPVQTPVTGGT